MEPHQELENRLKNFRVKCRNNSVKVTSTIIDNHQASLCVFCGEKKNLTKEHVVPKWTFEGCPKREFLTQSNNQPHSYNKTTVQACKECNNFHLGFLEKYLKDIFNKTNLKNGEFFDVEDLENIVRWLELIDYKFQVHNLQKRFIRHRDSKYIEFLRDFPIAMFRQGQDTPSKVFTEYRRAHRKLSKKSKIDRLNSLLIFHSKNPDFAFFHTVNDFLFIELPRMNIAILYFYVKNHKSPEEAHKEGSELIEHLYSLSRKKE